MAWHPRSKLRSTILIPISSALDRVARNDALEVTLVQLGIQMVAEVLLPGSISSSSITSLMTILIATRG